MSILIWALTGLGGLYWWKTGQPPTETLVSQPGAVYPDRRRNPMILRDDVLEKSFMAQKQTSVRLPFGPPNSLQRTIDDPALLLSNPEYGKQFQKNMRNVEFRTQEFRVDPMFNSPLNNYSSMHVPECILCISNWAKRSDNLKTQ